MAYAADILNLVDPSLYPLLIRDCGEPSDFSRGEFARYLNKEHLPGMGVSACRIAGLLVLAHCLWLLEKHEEDEVSPEMMNIVRQVWSGHQDCGGGTCLSLLQCAAGAPDGSRFRSLVTDVHVLNEWSRYINFRTWGYKAFDKVVRATNFYVLLTRLLKSLPVLQHGKLECVNGNPVFVLGVPGGALRGGSASPFRFPAALFSRSCDDIDNRLLLYRLDRSKENPAATFDDPYSSYVETLEIRQVPELKAVFRYVNGILGNPDVREDVLVLFGRDYAHLQNLARAIAMTSAPLCKTAFTKLKRKWFESGTDKLASLRDYYVAGMQKLKGQSSGRNGQDHEIARLDLDCLVLLLAELGPRKVLTDLFKTGDWDIFEELLNELEKLTGNSASKWREEYERHKEMNRKKIQAYLGVLDPAASERLTEDIDLESRIWCLVKASGLEFTPPSYVESMSHKLSMLKQWSVALNADHGRIKETIIDVNWLLERTLRFLLCFYEGFRAYHAELESTDDNKTLDQVMANAARKEYERCKKFPLGPLIGEFRRMATVSPVNKSVPGSDISGAGGQKGENRAESAAGMRPRKQPNQELLRLLERYLDRRTLCDMTAFKILNHDNYVSCVNAVKHTGHPKVDWETAKWFVGKTIELFELLRFGSRGCDQGNKFCFSGAIYPVVVSFREVRRQCDGLVTYSYELKSAGDQHALQSVRILTRHQYDAKEEYYCLPNSRFTGAWWLDPYLVSCDLFDSIFDPGEWERKEAGDEA